MLREPPRLLDAPRDYVHPPPRGNQRGHDGPRRSPGSQHDGGSAVECEAAPQVGQEPGGIGVVAQQATLLDGDRVHGTHGCGRRRERVEVGDDGLLVRDGNVEPVYLAAPHAGEEFA